MTNTKLPDFLFFLAIYADFRLFFVCKPLSLTFNIAHLLISAVIFLAADTLVIDSQGISQLPCQSWNRAMFNLETLPFQFLCNLTRGFTRPLQSRNWTSGSRILQKLFERIQYPWLFFFNQGASCSWTTNSRKRSFVRMFNLTTTSNNGGAAYPVISASWDVPPRPCWFASTPTNCLLFLSFNSKSTRLIAWCCWAVLPYGCDWQSSQLQWWILRLALFRIGLILIYIFNPSYWSKNNLINLIPRQAYHILNWFTYSWINT